MKDRRETLISWLNDAYSMERGIVPVLENHVKDADRLPEVQNRLRAHLEQTKRQGDQVKMLVERLGGSTSAVKTTMGTVAGFFQGMSTGAAPDELVKNALADYSTEHFEIACYRALIAGAQALGETEVVRVCEQILREEEEMARWLESQLPQLVQLYLGQEATVGASHTAGGFGTSGTPTPGGTTRF
jgi:ferritin-like metal-binding protein YciE